MPARVQQLSLFSGLELDAGVIPADAQAQLDAAPPDPRQMDLFGDRWLSASEAHRALEQFALDAAAAALKPLLTRYPQDLGLRDRARYIDDLARAIERARAGGASPVAALVYVEPIVPAFLHKSWHAKVAREIERECGDGASFDGVPAGHHFVRAGEWGEAERSLRLTLARDAGDARTRAYLADALTAQDKLRAEARLHYRDAFARHPEHIDRAALVDSAVARLGETAEIDFDVPDDGWQWSAAVGVMTGLFMAPDWTALRATAPTGPAAAGVEFYHWLGRELLADHLQERVACRRAMQGLSKTVFEQFMERMRS